MFCVGVFGALLVVLGALTVRAARTQSERVRELLYRSPGEIDRVELLVLQRNGGRRLPTVQIVDKKGARFGLMMPDESSARTVCAAIRR